MALFDPNTMLDSLDPLKQQPVKEEVEEAPKEPEQETLENPEELEEQPTETEEEEEVNEEPTPTPTPTPVKVDYDFGPEDVSEYTQTAEDFFAKSYGITKDHPDIDAYKAVFEEINKKNEIITQLKERLDSVKNMGTVKEAIAVNQAQEEFSKEQVEWANEFEEVFPDEAKTIRKLGKKEKERVINEITQKAWKAYYSKKVQGKKVSNPFIAVSNEVKKLLTPKETEKKKPTTPTLNEMKKNAALSGGVPATPTKSKDYGHLRAHERKAAMEIDSAMSSLFKELDL